MQIYMTFRGADVERRGPSLTWLRTSMALELMELSPDLRSGTVSLERLRLGLEHARNALLDPAHAAPALVRTAADRAALVAALDLLEQGMLQAESAGATEFQWREDF